MCRSSTTRCWRRRDCARTQRAILVYIERGGSPSMGELAAALVLDRTALNHNLKPLQRDGLVDHHRRPQ